MDKNGGKRRRRIGQTNNPASSLDNSSSDGLVSLSPSHVRAHVSPSQDSAHLLVPQRTLRSGKAVTTETGLIPSIPLNSGTLINRQFTSTLKGRGHTLSMTDQSKSLYGSKTTGNGLGRKRNRDEINKENVMEEEEVTTRRQTKRRFLKMDDGDNEEEEEEVEKEEKEEEEVEESISSVLCKRFPGRQRQVNTLLSLMGKLTDFTPHTLFVYGHSSTGKTSLIQKLLNITKVHHSYTNMTECYSSRILFETILNQLTGVIPSHHNKFIGYSRCDSLSEFIHQLKTILLKKGGEVGDTVYIVIDNAERLRDMESTLLQAVMRLPQLVSYNICVILISSVLWDKFACSEKPFVLYFDQYDKDDVIKILSNDLNPSQYSSSFIMTYATLVWNVVSPVSRDLTDLLYISKMMFSLYSEPVQSGQVLESDSRKLWNHIDPYFRQHVTNLLLRTQSSEKCLIERRSVTINSKAVTSDVSSSVDGSIQLPYMVKFLLISSYLASYNPLNTDRRFFSKSKQKKRRHDKAKKKQEELKRYLIGPKSFPLDRLMAIFHSITGGSTKPTPNLYSQVETLVGLKCLSRTGGGSGSLDAVRYKCLTSFESIRSIAKEYLIKKDSRTSELYIIAFLLFCIVGFLFRLGCS